MKYFQNSDVDFCGNMGTYLHDFPSSWFVTNGRDDIPALYALDSKMTKHLILNNYRTSMKSLLSIVEEFLKAKDYWAKSASDNETAGGCCDCV